MSKSQTLAEQIRALPYEYSEGRIYEAHIWEAAVLAAAELVDRHARENGTVEEVNARHALCIEKLKEAEAKAVSAENRRRNDEAIADRLVQEARRRESEAKAAMRELFKAYKAADDERLKETDENYAEAAKWQAEGDMYGWNFYQGKSSGTTAASIIFYRVYRLLEEYAKKLEMSACLLYEGQRDTPVAQPVEAVS